ncbi:MAG: hypothetical protein ACKPGN_18685 [Dolichospermum sp.]
MFSNQLLPITNYLLPASTNMISIQSVLVDNFQVPVSFRISYSEN